MFSVFSDPYLMMAVDGHTQKDVQRLLVLTPRGIKKLESRWHQCPRCSFWFDCVTEPSFATRPEECPPNVNNDTVNLDIQHSITETKQEFDVAIIPDLVPGDSETGLSVIKQDHSGTSLTVDSTDESIISPSVAEQANATAQSVGNITSIISLSEATGPLFDEIKQEPPFLPNTDGNETDVIGFEQYLTEFPVYQPLISKISDGNKPPVQSNKLGKLGKDNVSDTTKFSRAHDEANEHTKTTKRKIAGKSGHSKRKKKVSDWATVAHKLVTNFGREKNESKNEHETSDTPNEAKTQKNVQTGVQRATSVNKHSGTVKKTKIPGQTFQIQEPNKSDQSYKLKGMSSLKKIKLKIKVVYYIDGTELSEYKKKQYERMWKQCSACGKVIINTKLHLYNYHKDMAGCQVKFDILKEEQDEQKKAEKTQNTVKPPKMPSGRSAKQCNVCQMWVMNMTRHMSIHARNTILFPCPKCKKIYKHKKSLDKHICPADQEKPNHEKCTVCDIWFSDLIPHLKSHTAKGDFSCVKCTYSFVSKEDLANHLNKFCPKLKNQHDEPIIACTMCNALTYESKMEAHKRHSHFTERFSCPKCGKQERDKRSLENHLQLHEGVSIPCPLCPKFFRSPYLLYRHKRGVHVDKKYKCEKCGFRFKLMGSLRSHMKTHSSILQEQHKCPQCSKILRNKHSLAKHISVIHNKESLPLFHCDQCPKSFPAKNQLKQHIIHRHSDARPVQCNSCSKCFKTKSALRSHMIIMHNRERPFLCTECGAAYPINQQLLQHIQRKHTPISNRPKFPCENPLCNKAFLSKEAMLKHMKSAHEEPRCTECNILFETYQEFKIHKMQHAGKVIDTCSICGKQFPWKHMLINHMKTHKGVQVPEPSAIAGPSERVG